MYPWKTCQVVALVLYWMGFHSEGYHSGKGQPQAGDSLWFVLAKYWGNKGGSSERASGYITPVVPNSNEKCHCE